jgi:hypothetical protein
MNVFWAFAFPPWPPATWRDALWPVRRVLFLFLNPLDYSEPFGPRVSPWPAVVLFSVGVASLWRRNRLTLAIATLPLLFGLAAAYAHRYPFHGRLALYLVPGLILVTAEGAGRALGSVRSRAARGIVLAALLLVPTFRALDRLVEPRYSTDHNIRFGDLRPNSLDPDRYPF